MNTRDEQSLDWAAKARDRAWNDFSGPAPQVSSGSPYATAEQVARFEAMTAARERELAALPIPPEELARKARVKKGQARGRWITFRERAGWGIVNRLPMAGDDYRARDAELAAAYRELWRNDWEPPAPVTAYLDWLRAEGRGRLAAEIEERGPSSRLG